MDRPLTEKMAKDSTFCENGLFKPYKSLPNKPKDVFKWHKVYKELCAQYDKFLLVTEGKGDCRHIDFHLWYNLTWPVAIALNLFTWTHKIKSVRYRQFKPESAIESYDQIEGMANFLRKKDDPKKVKVVDFKNA